METNDRGINNQQPNPNEEQGNTFAKDTAANQSDDAKKIAAAELEETIDENKEERHHHQQHGNRKYKMFSNHSSADDQPLTNTDTTP